MALIRCIKCGEEISDKATKCIHCGNFTHKKKWNELTNSEKNTISLYRNKIHEWWKPIRLLMLAFIPILFIGLNSFFSNIPYNFYTVPIVCALSIIILIYFNNKEQKKWYEDNIDKLYENEILK